MWTDTARSPQLLECDALHQVKDIKFPLESSALVMSMHSKVADLT